jgi:hypothetical protein
MADEVRAATAMLSSTADSRERSNSSTFMKKSSSPQRREIPSVAVRRSATPQAIDALTNNHRRGRPSKFGRAARAVTVTLPEDVIDRLTAINLDISRAIVELADAARATTRPRAIPATVELSEYGQGALIVVSPVDGLRKLPGVELIPLSDGRSLIALENPGSLSELELGLRDMLDDDTYAAGDREALEGVATILRRARQSPDRTVRTRIIIVIEPKRRTRKIQRPKRP